MARAACLPIVEFNWASCNIMTGQRAHPAQHRLGVLRCWRVPVGEAGMNCGDRADLGRLAHEGGRFHPTVFPLVLKIRVVRGGFAAPGLERLITVLVGVPGVLYLFGNMVCQQAVAE